MKKLAIAMMLGVSALTASAQVNYKVQTACHPQDVKHYDTERLRNSFMMEKVMAPDEINVTYTLYDRLIYGGAMPVNKVLKLETFRELGPEITYFLERRELGVINIWWSIRRARVWMRLHATRFLKCSRLRSCTFRATRQRLRVMWRSCAARAIRSRRHRHSICSRELFTLRRSACCRRNLEFMRGNGLF